MFAADRTLLSIESIMSTDPAAARVPMANSSAGRQGGFDLYAHPERLLWLLAAWHLLFWVLAPMLTYRMLPLDTLELLGWGQQWQWGYYKHPPLGAWLGEIALQISGGRLSALYVLAQVCVLLTLYYVWKTARLFLDRHAAVVATAVLEGAYWYTYLTPNFNMNTLQLPVWAGLSYHFVRALRGDHHHWWAWGVFVALCLYTKYSGLLLIATCALILVGSSAGRASLRTRGPYLAGLLALVLLLPHLAWLSKHWQLPWSYLRGFDRDAVAIAYPHVLEPLRFAIGALLGLLFSALLFLLLIDRSAQLPRPRREAWLILALCLGPLLISTCYGIVTGSRLKSTWAFGFFNLAGVAWCLLIPTRIDRVRFRRFCAGLAVVALFVACIHVAYKTQSERSKTRFDGQALATAIADDWQQTMPGPLRIVVGDHILSAIVSAYAPTRPAMLVQGDFAISPWLTPEDLRRDGAVVVCASDTNCFADLIAAASRRHQIEIGARRFDYYFLAANPAQSVSADRRPPSATQSTPERL